MSETLQFEKIVDTTTNTLKDFDVAAALTFKSINVQLADAWKKWNHQTGGLNTFRKEMVKESEDGDPENNTTYSINLSLGNPVISSDPVGQSIQEVVVTFDIASGTMVKAVGKRSATLDMSGRRFWYTARLLRNEVGPEQLYRIDEQTAKTVAALTGMPGAGTLTIECLFLNLTKINIISGFAISPVEPAEIGQRLQHSGYAPTFLAKPENLSMLRKDLEDQFALLLRDHFIGGRNPDGGPAGQFLLNTTLRPRRPAVEASLLINDIRFKVTRAPANKPGAHPSSLDYLGTVVGGRAMPADGSPLDNALSGLGSWLTPSRVDGTQAMAAGLMALRGGRVAKLMAEIFQKVLPEEYARMKAENDRVDAEFAARGQRVAKPEVEYPYPEYKLLNCETPNWIEETGTVSIKSSDDSNTYRWSNDEDGNKVNFTLKKSLRLDLKPKTNECFIVDGSYKIDISRKRDTVWGEVDAWAVTEVPITGTVIFQANSEGLVCEISPEIKITIGEAIQTSDASDSNFLVSLFNESSWDMEQAIGFSGAIGMAIKKMLEESFSRLNLRIKDFVIIPPGGEAFGFSKPRIGQNGDLFLDLVYRTSLKPK